MWMSHVESTSDFLFNYKGECERSLSTARVSQESYWNMRRTEINWYNILALTHENHLPHKASVKKKKKPVIAGHVKWDFFFFYHLYQLQ